MTSLRIFFDYSRSRGCSMRQVAQDRDSTNNGVISEITHYNNAFQLLSAIAVDVVNIGQTDV